MMKCKQPIILLGILPILLQLVSCSPSEAPPNVILIIPDALRAKQLPCYGYKKNQTPNIDALANDSVRFENCYVPRASTFPSFSNLFSGLRFPRNGLLDGEKTMAEYFKENGYKTMGVVSSRILWSKKHQEKGRVKSEFYRGFDEYFQDASLRKFPYHRKNKETTRDILNWLDKNKYSKQPFFMFAHYMDPHYPYKPSYNGEISKIDRELGVVIAKLKELGIYDNSLIIFTSDHGESLGSPVKDHGSPLGHGWLTYNEQHRVPLLVKMPGKKFVKSIRQVVRNIDVLPTLLNYFDFKYDPGKIDGKSLLPAFKEDKDLKLSAFLWGGNTRVCPGGSFGIVFPYKQNIFKFIRSGFSKQFQELYNLDNDPGERNNLAGDKSYLRVIDKAIYLISDNEKIAKIRMQNNQKIKTDENEVEMEALKSLGYIAGGAPSPTITSNLFLMQKKIADFNIKYHSIIRNARWGHDRKDKIFPVKILPTNGEEYYLIVNKNKILVKYDYRKKKFHSLKTKRILDMDFDFKENRLLLLTSGKINIWNAVNSSLKPLYEFSHDGFPGVKKAFIHCDRNGNIFTATKTGVINLDFNGKLLKRYAFDGNGPNRLCVDTMGNIYVATNDKVTKYSREGKRLTSFTGVNYPSKTISAIASDGEKNIWVLGKDFGEVTVFNVAGQKVDSFIYNNCKASSGWRPVPTRQIRLHNKRFYLVDNWESILTYEISYMGR